MQVVLTLLHAVRRWNTERPGLTWQRFMENKNKELERLNGVYMKLLEGSKVDYHEGRGRVVDAHTVEVDGRRFTVRTHASWSQTSQGSFLRDEQGKACSRGPRLRGRCEWPLLSCLWDGAHMCLLRDASV